MPEVKLPDVAFSWENIIYVVALIVAFAGVLVAIVKGWEAWKKISVRDRVKQLEGRMDKVEARLLLGDKRFDLQSDDMEQTLKSLQALTLHFMTGNDHVKLREQFDELSDYITHRATRATEYALEQEQYTQNVGGNHNG